MLSNKSSRVKHSLIGVFLTLLLSLESGFSEPLPPQWFEFCPSKYENAKLFGVKTHWTPGMYASLLLVPLFPPLIAIPIRKSRELHSMADENDYWANRRPQFELAVSQCKESDDKTSCYMQVRQLELQKTAMHQQQLDNAALRRTVRSLRYY